MGTTYNIQMDVQYKGLELIDAVAHSKRLPDKWWNQTLCKVNDSLVRLGVFEGEFHWHKHDREDEYFHVIEGRLFLDFQDRTVELAPNQGMMVPRGVVHRTRAPQRTVVLMVEADTIVPTGDAGKP
jgi:mannose-6-phosphate isomerase-like protein (cupin superfamily)